MAQEKWLVDGPKVIDIEIVRKLKVGLISGQVDIVAHDEPGARVEVHSVAGRELKISVDGDSLEIDHPQLRWDNWVDAFASFRGNARADVSILVPRDVALKFGVVNASGLISGIQSTSPPASQIMSSANPPIWVVRTLSTTIGAWVASNTTFTAMAAYKGRERNRSTR